jgi:hypothetical protein
MIGRKYLPPAGNRSIDHGGPEVSTASFFAVYWNGNVAASQQTPGGSVTMQQYIANFAISFGSGSEYSGSPLDDYSIIQQYGSKDAISREPAVYRVSRGHEEHPVEHQRFQYPQLPDWPVQSQSGHAQPQYHLRPVFPAGNADHAEFVPVVVHMPS